MEGWYSPTPSTGPCDQYVINKTPCCQSLCYYNCQIVHLYCLIIHIMVLCHSWCYSCQLVYFDCSCWFCVDNHVKFCHNNNKIKQWKTKKMIKNATIVAFLDIGFQTVASKLIITTTCLPSLDMLKIVKEEHVNFIKEHKSLKNIGSFPIRNWWRLLWLTLHIIVRFCFNSSHNSYKLFISLIVPR